DRASHRAAWHRTVDRAIHRHARVGLARRVSRQRSPRAESDERNEAGASAGAQRSVASLAGVRRHAFMERSVMSFTIHYCTIATPLGEMLLVARDDALCGAYFSGQKYFPTPTAEWTADPSE